MDNIDDINEHHRRRAERKQTMIDASTGNRKRFSENVSTAP